MSKTETIEAMLEAYRTSEFSDDNPPDLSFPLLAMQAAYAMAYDDIRNEVLGKAPTPTSTERTGRMMPLNISGSTRRLAEDQPQYVQLAIRDVTTEIGSPAMQSVWEPSPKELEMLARGGAVVLTILGNTHPPVKIETQEPPDA